MHSIHQQPGFSFFSLFNGLPCWYSWSISPRKTHHDAVYFHLCLCSHFPCLLCFWYNAILKEFFPCNYEYISSLPIKISFFGKFVLPVHFLSFISVNKFLVLQPHIIHPCFHSLLCGMCSSYNFHKSVGEELSAACERDLRCLRLVAHGKWLAQDLPKLRLVVYQPNKSIRNQFSTQKGGNKNSSQK